MKHILLLITGALVIGCTGHNELRTRLLNKSKQLQDSVGYYSINEKDYAQKSKTSATNLKDTITWKVMVDSSAHFFHLKEHAQEKLKAINFSLDSLSRMK